MIAAPKPRKLLVVDDEPLVRETLDFCLRDDYDITSVASGEEAIKISRVEDFPVVILDLRMEGLSGIETLKKLKQIRATQNVIILTAYESMETAITALNLGAFNYLTKPFQHTHLREVIARGFDAYDLQTLREKEIQNRLLNVHDTFLSLLCHEFNTPLNVILGVSELLGENLTDSEQKVWMQDINNAGTHLHDILMEIVDYVGASHLAAAGADDDFILTRLLQPMIHSLDHENLAVVLNVDEGPARGRKLRGPSHSISLIARKLIRMASHQSERIHIYSRLASLEDQEDLQLQLVVSGTGLHTDAMRKNDLDQLFEPYQFTPKNSKGRRTALGLELATCRKIAEYAHGSVDCVVTPNGDIDFSATIPVKLIPQSPAHP